MTIDEFLNSYRIILRGECWEWKGSMTHRSTPGPTYARIWIRVDGKAKQRQAHRVAWEIARGPIPAGAVLVNRTELCDCGTGCVNPDHWTPVARAKVPRLMAKERRTSAGLKHAAATLPGRRRTAKLTLEVARQIRASDESHAALALRHGISRQMVSGIKLGRYWAEPSPFGGLLAA